MAMLETELIIVIIIVVIEIAAVTVMIEEVGNDIHIDREMTYRGETYRGEK